MISGGLNEPRREKTFIPGFRPGPTQTGALPGCTAIEDGQRLDIPDLGSRLDVAKTKPLRR